uniref:F-box protein n=1 Tax=Quercus lobata TaxID=97700 RepID=A0A7N2RCI2_QUELO
MTKKKAKAEKEDEKFGGTDIIPQLHPNIVTDILSRLPFSTLFSCFCPKTQVYKVVLLSKKQYGAEVNNNMVTLVYTLGEKGNGLWKSVNVGNGLLHQPGNTTFLNGIIHRVVRAPSVPQFIYSFDVEDECLKESKESRIPSIDNASDDEVHS